MPMPQSAVSAVCRSPARRPWEHVLIALGVDIGAPRAHSGCMETDIDRNIRASLDGDGEAYARIVRKYQDEITGRMWRFTRDRGLLEELVSDVFVEAYKSLGGYRGSGPFAHWLHRIATRVGYRFWRKNRRRAAREINLEDWQGIAAGGADGMAASEAAELVHDLLSQIPPRDRLVLTLMYLEQLPVARIAAYTGWSETMVKVQAYRARKKLRKVLQSADT